MTGHELARIFKISEMTVKLNTEGVTHEESLVHPEQGGNCLNWELGHVLTSRDGLFGFLGERPVLGSAEQKTYGRGSTSLSSSGGALQLGRLLEAFDASQDRLLARLSEITEEQLSAPLQEPHEILGETVGEAAGFMQWHEAYHMGRIGLLRRVLGKDGRIA